MIFISCITLLLLPTVILADYDIDNANTSVVYSMPPSSSGQSWQTFAVGIQSIGISFSNSSGNFSINFDASHCYDQNYAQGQCGTGDNCFIQIPFTGSGITMYIFNAGMTGMTASFSVDGGTAVSNSTAPPTVAENYQVSNVSLYDVQGLPSGNHTIKMTLMDWDGAATDMKFDYAHVNETFVAVPSTTTASSTPTTASTPTQTLISTASASNRIGVGGIVGIALGVAAMLGGIVIGILWFRKRRASHRESSGSAPESTFKIEPYTPEYLTRIISSSRPHTQHSPSISLQSDDNSVVSPLMRSAILRDALAVGSSSAPIQRQQSVRPGATASVLQPLRRQPSYSPVSLIADEETSTFSDPAIAPQHNLTPAQIETVRGLLEDRVPAETITRVIEAFVLSQSSTGEANARQVIPSSEYAFSLESPPSYQTRAR